MATQEGGETRVSVLPAAEPTSNPGYATSPVQRCMGVLHVQGFCRWASLSWHGDEDFLLNGLTRMCMCLALMDAAVSAGFGQSKGLGVSPTQKRSCSFSGGGRGKGGKGHYKGMLLPTWSRETKEFHHRWFLAVKEQKDSPTPTLSGFWGSVLNCFILRFCTVLTSQNPDTLQSRALPFQHLKGFDILAFFPMKQQVLTGHVVGAAACMPQAD